MSGDDENAATAAAHVATLEDAAAGGGDGDRAVLRRRPRRRPSKSIRAFLLRARRPPRGHAAARPIGMARDVLDDAELLLEAVLELAPDYQAARHDYARCWSSGTSTGRRAREIDQLLALTPPTSTTGRWQPPRRRPGRAGAGDRALPRAARRRAAAAADLHLWIAHALKTVGQRRRGDRRLPRGGGGSAPDFGDAYWSLANLKTYRFTDAEIARMRAAEAAPATAPEDRYHLCFALGKALEDRGEIAESWRYYERGNALKRAESRYRPEIIETNTRKQIEVCTRDFFAAARRLGRPEPDPIFIVGLPRSGSTLIEQILASHSQVEGTQELADIPRIVLDLQGRDPDLDNPRYPAALADLTRRGFRRGWASAISPRRGSTAPASRSSSTRCRTTSGTSA